MTARRAPSASLRPGSLGRALAARPRLLGSAAVGIAVFAITGMAWPLAASARVLLGWNAGALLYLLLAWQGMAGTQVRTIRQQALRHDEGRHVILALVVIAALAVLLAVGTQLAQAKGMQGDRRDIHLVLAGITVLTSWLFTQVLFAQHYAHDFYAAREAGAEDPLCFPGTRDPGYTDFFYFSCVIGTSAQTADVSFNGSALRPVGTLHCVVSFFFNATLLALSINLAAGLLL